MSKTLRRKPWYPAQFFPRQKEPVGNARWRKIANDSTCKPGCGVCGKDHATRRAEHKRSRRAGRAAAQED